MTQADSLLPPNVEQRMEVFFPFALDRQRKVVRERTRFVHYTDARAAMNMLQEREVWMRNALSMNDFREVSHGLDCIQKAYHNGQHGLRLRSTLDQIFTGISAEIDKQFQDWSLELRANTYLVCLSEHDEDENDIADARQFLACEDDQLIRRPRFG